MLELVRKQTEDSPLGTKGLSFAQMLDSKINRVGQIGKYVKILTHEIPYPQTKKVTAMKEYS